MGSQLTTQEKICLQEDSCMAQAYRNSRRSKQLKRHGRRKARQVEKIILQTELNA